MQKDEKQVKLAGLRLAGLFLYLCIVARINPVLFRLNILQ